MKIRGAIGSVHFGLLGTSTHRMGDMTASNFDMHTDPGPIGSDILHQVFRDHGSHPLKFEPNRFELLLRRSYLDPCIHATCETHVAELISLIS